MWELKASPSEVTDWFETWLSPTEGFNHFPQVGLQNIGHSCNNYEQKILEEDKDEQGVKESILYLYFFSYSKFSQH